METKYRATKRVKNWTIGEMHYSCDCLLTHQLKCCIIAGLKLLRFWIYTCKVFFFRVSVKHDNNVM